MATMVSVATALIFPVIYLGALWSFGLDGIWFNFVGVNFSSTLLGIVLLLTVAREIKKKKALE